MVIVKLTKAKNWTIHVNNRKCIFTLSGKENVVSLLISRGANVNATNCIGQLPIHAASKSGHARVVDLLLRKGSDIRFANQDGDTALHISAARGLLGFSEKLLFLLYYLT